MMAMPPQDEREDWTKYYYGYCCSHRLTNGITADTAVVTVTQNAHIKGLHAYEHLFVHS